jgi:Asp-tRNA(Asn)/Glu-tRNA(Gln) amidotransferase A subunit family amidase
VLEAKHRIDEYEVSRAFGYERLYFPEKISAALTAKFARADKCTFDQYVVAQRRIGECRRLLDDVFVNFDVLLVPSTPGEAPLGLNTTGNSIFNRIWTGLHVPAVTVPVFTGPTGLPMGAQLIGCFGADQKTLVCAEWVRRALT